jgi:hypothetical protein
VARKLWLYQPGHEDPFDVRRTQWVDILHRWFDFWLQGLPNGVTREPRATLETAPGVWTQERDWPARGARDVTVRLGSGDGATGTLSDVLDRSFKVYIGASFRRADFDRVGGFDETMTHAEDFDFWVRLLLDGGHARYIDEVLGEYRVRPNSASASAARMIAGNLRVYEKAITHLGEGPEAGVAHRMIADNHAALAFEEAMNQVAEGDTARGLAALRAARRGQGGLVWALAFWLWRPFPQLAPPMMRWRRKSNARGRGTASVPALSMRQAAS